ncbi:MAG: carboxypeptidase-like regulatory domain-containing protein [Bacteroidota bacterium]|nr:carboxypeptidase-like regulatory domain-containing protein [Bacteroidota bacterium]
MVKFRYGVVIIAIIQMLAIIGCDKDDDKDSSSNPASTSLSTYEPRGTISGLIRDRITNEPVSGAVISVGFDGVVHSTTSDVAGAFSFASVPAGQYQIVNGTSVPTGTYTLTVSLLSKNAAETNLNKKYRDYYYTTVTIRFTSLATGDSVAVDGLVGSTLLTISHLNTTLSGLVVDRNSQPVANATVTLYDATVFPINAMSQTKTSASGAYKFSNIDNGLTINVNAQSTDGSLEGNLAANFTLPANVTTDSVRSQVNAERIVILPVDNVNPYIISTSPENVSDVSPTNLKVVYTFSEPIKQTPYTRTDLPAGHNTIVDDIVVSYDGFKKTTANLGFSLQWDTVTYKQLTVTPQGIQGSSKYSVNFNVAANSGKITDEAGRALVNNVNLTGDFEVLQFTTGGSSVVPGVPTLARRNVPGQFAELDFTGGTVGLQWNVSADARSYNIYRSINGGTFDLLQKDFFGTQFSTPSGSLVNPSGVNNPLSAINVRYQVRAVSKDLVESAPSNTITVTDGVKPKLSNAVVAAGPSVFTWVYTLRFTEPMNIAASENPANYSFATTGGVFYTVNRADYLGFNAGTGTYNIQLSVTSSAAPVVGYSLISGNSVIDLSGLGVDPTANSKTF